MFHGTYLGEASRPEHLPYVRAGFAVVAYEIDGIAPEREHLTYADFKEPAIEFRDAKAGLVNAQTAISYATAKVPQIDLTKLFTAGHSSAATLSILVAENDSRIKACVAYAPVTDIVKDLGSDVNILEKMIPGYRNFLIQSSPITYAEKLKYPIFLFYAKDDSVVPIEQSIDFAEKVKQINSSVTLISADNGNHYNSMIKEGVPQAIEWLKKLR